MASPHGEPAGASPRIPRPVTHGLLGVPGVRDISGRTLDRWVNGVRYRPYSLPTVAELPGGGFDTGAWDECANNPDIGWNDKDLIEWPGFGIYATEECPVLGTDAQERDGLLAKARRKLDNHASHIIEGVLATGTLQNGDTLAGIDAGDDAVAFTAAGNTAIGAQLDAATDINTAWDVIPAFQAIVHWAASAASGTAVWIHAPAEIMWHLLNYNMIRRDGNITLLNVSDHRIVLGTGYTGAAPTGATAIAGDGSEYFVYVTSPVTVWMTDADAPPELGETVVRSTNRLRAIAKRMVVVEHDLNIRGAIKVGLPNPGPGIV